MSVGTSNVLYGSPIDAPSNLIQFSPVIHISKKGGLNLRLDFESLPVQVLDSVQIHRHETFIWLNTHHASSTRRAKEMAIRALRDLVGG